MNSISQQHRLALLWLLAILVTAGCAGSPESMTEDTQPTATRRALAQESAGAWARFEDGSDDHLEIRADLSISRWGGPWDASEAYREDGCTVVLGRSYCFQGGVGYRSGGVLSA